MRAFLREFWSPTEEEYTVVILDGDAVHPPRQHVVRPRTLRGLVLAAMGLTGLLVLLLLVLTPIRELIPGYGTTELRRNARVNALRVAALEDSLRTQQQYLDQVRRIIMGEADSTMLASRVPDEPEASVTGPLAEIAEARTSENWDDHAQPALPVTQFAANRTRPAQSPPTASYLASLPLPALPPVDGIVTRGYNAQQGHYAIDFAVEEGTPVRSIGDGYVVFADWTHDGGYGLIVQHAEGFVSVYKHNQRLLKRIGDRVRDREPVALSGNTGEITSGPHLHFELWRDGLAQDPQLYLLGE